MGRRRSPSRESSSRPANAFTVDVEDYFQVTAFDRTVRRGEWEKYPLRVEANTRRLLDLLNRFDTKGTFFVLGWIAERAPGLVRDIAEEGHEIGSHGYDHRRVTEMSRDEFRADTRKSKAILEDITGTAVLGYRAASFSIVSSTTWALEVLAEAGFTYDSSVFPIRHDRYGIPGAPRFPWRVETPSGGSIVECPMSTVRLGPFSFPFTGGGYLRLLPLALNRWGFRRVNQSEGRPVVLYVHPWEVDPEQPRLSASGFTRWRHYGNLRATMRRLEALLREFSFSPMREMLGL